LMRVRVWVRKLNWLAEDGFNVQS